MITPDRAVNRGHGVYSNLGHYSSLLLQKAASTINALPPGVFSRTNQAAIDCLITAISLYLAFQLRFDFAVPPHVRVVMWAWIMLMSILRPGVIALLGSYRGIWRYFNLHDAGRLALSGLPASALLILIRYSFGGRYWISTIPITVIVIEFGQFVIFAFGARALRRAVSEVSRPQLKSPVRTLIVGSADTLAEALRRVTALGEMVVVALVSPDIRLRGLRIGGFAVMGEPESLPKLLANEVVDLILISDASLQCLGDIVATATDFGVSVRLLPSAANVIRGDVRVSALADPEMIFTDRGSKYHKAPPEVVEGFRDKTVLITGAGGSIGSELSRQVALLPISCLVLLDHDENSIFEIHRQLRESAREVNVVPKVGDILDRTLMTSIFQTLQPHIVLHAAAYKHVSVMESNSSAAILNNVAGTRAVAELAVCHGAERFLMISTDKAVRPSSVMGASKRIAELVIQDIVRRQETASLCTHCACVRFGNVVGSRGSVVPIFLEQIAAGGPVTITDSEMTRYFMTIPEAVQLVLQATILATNAEIYVLDMGDPVKITTLARRLIEMSGLRPGTDVEIRCIGSGPGEKVHEELWSQAASLDTTMFPGVLRIQESPAPPNFGLLLRPLVKAAQARNDALVVRLLEAMQIGFRTHAVNPASPDVQPRANTWGGCIQPVRKD